MKHEPIERPSLTIVFTRGKPISKMEIAGHLFFWIVLIGIAVLI